MLNVHNPENVNMNTIESTQVEAVRQMTNKELVLAVIQLQKDFAEMQGVLELLKTTPAQTKSDTKEMTDDDARRILSGDMKDKKHKDAASELGLTYGQVYSCRLGFTFKPIHKEMKENNIANPWVK
jgi:hypothetical protein